MSLSALLIACRNSLRIALPGWEEDSIQIRPDSAPSPIAGEQFLAVYGSGWTPADRDVNRALDERYNVSVTLSQRATAVPFDRAGDDIYIKAATGMEAVMRKVIVTLHQSITVMSAANDLIDGEDKIVEYLRWFGTDPAPIPKRGDWWNSDAPGRSGRGSTPDPQYVAGYIMTARFGDARRVQRYSEME